MASLALVPALSAIANFSKSEICLTSARERRERKLSTSVAGDPTDEDN